LKVKGNKKTDNETKKQILKKYKKNQANLTEPPNRELIT
jgi:hypothetical protein